MRRFIILAILLFPSCLFAQTTASSMRLGMNLGGISDYMTEMPFVDVMHQAREWYTQNCAWVEGGTNAFNTGYIDSVAFDSNGYPLKLPIHVVGAETLQIASTIFADLTGWPEGTYVLLFDGTGSFSFWGDLAEISESAGRIELKFTRPSSGVGAFQLSIAQTDSTDHIRNIRLLMPGTEGTYTTMPFYEPWFTILKKFHAVRFMDWGSTNNWGTGSSEVTDADTVLTDWNGRAKPTHYTWATNKGVPYEMMITLCNLLNEDMWICVPHLASNDYIRQMATLIKQNLNAGLKVYVEYGNEDWNWMFGQTQWLYKFGCVNKGITWPEGIVPYIQNCMDIFSDVFADEMTRLVRVVGVQAAWQDVSNRIVFNMRKGSFDAFAPAAYFGLSEHADSVLDDLGSSAVASDVARLADSGMVVREEPWLQSQATTIADSLHIPMFFYEGGQHLTPTPFGVEPTYAQALLDVQRDTALYSLYSKWYAFLDSLSASLTAPPLFMVFSYVGSRSARYGSWGMLESITQDTSAIPAPKYRAIMEYLARASTAVTSGTTAVATSFRLEQNVPNPFNPTTVISGQWTADSWVTLVVYDVLGREVARLADGRFPAGRYSFTFDARGLASGVYFCRLTAGTQAQIRKMVLVR